MLCILCFNEISKTLQALFSGNHSPGPLLLLIGSVDVFEGCLGHAPVDGFHQFGSEFSLTIDGRPDGLFLFFEISERFKSCGNLPEFLVIQGPGRLLPVAGDERDGIALIHELDRGGDTLFGEGCFFCNLSDDIHVFLIKSGLAGRMLFLARP